MSHIELSSHGKVTGACWKSEMQKLIFARIKDVDMVRTREVDIAYYGMAEDVRVMGSFDGWTYGEQMSPESTSMYTRFTSTIKLRPGR
jgi:hypothetical protein